MCWNIIESLVKYLFYFLNVKRFKTTKYIKV